MNYLPILKLTLQHNYYPAGTCADFSIEPDATTEQLLLNHRCIIKLNPTGFAIYQQVNKTDAPLISLSTTTVFRFQLKPADSLYAVFTDLSEFSNLITPTFSNNGIANGQLALIDLDESKNSPAFANLEIHLLDTIKPVKANPTHYQIMLTAKQAHWEYFFITDENIDNANYQIKQDTSDNAIVFNKSPVPELKITDFLIKKHPKAKLFYFVSDKPVQCQQTPRKNIQIIRNDERLLNNLPNPSLNNTNQRITEDTGERVIQDSFFHIVQYITHSFSTTEI